MKKLLILTLILCFFCGCAATEEPSEAVTKPWSGKREPVLDQSPELTGKDLYIEPAQLSEDQQSLLNLLDFGREKYALFDFYIEETDHRLFFKTYQFKDGQWQFTEAEQENGSCDLGYKTSGRLLLDSDDLSRRLRIALQHTDGSGYTGTSYDIGTSVYDSGMFSTYTLPERTEIIYNQEIPLLLKIVPHDNSINIDDVHAVFENFSAPAAFAENAEHFELLYAVTITFSQIEQN